MKKRLKSLLAAMAAVAFAAALAVPALALADEPAGSGFDDVTGDEWFAADVEWANEAGLMTGTGDGAQFEPSLGNSRAMLVTSLHRLEGEPAPEAADPRVLGGKWYSDAANWAIEAGVLKGYDDGGLGLTDPLTREQLATFIWRYAQIAGVDVTGGEGADILSFVDAAKVSGYAAEAMRWCCAAGIITGYTDADGVPTGVLGPQDVASRAMTAAILHRLVDNVLPSTGEDEEETSTPPVYVHYHSYAWASNSNGTHTEICECEGKGATENCSMVGYSCAVCGYEDGAYHAKVSTNEELKSALSENAEKIIIDLTANVAYDVAAWDNNAMGGEATGEIVINGNGNTLTFNQTNSDWNNVVTYGAKLVLNNMAITNSGHNDGPWNRHDINFACEVEMSGVTSDKALAFKSGAVLYGVKVSDANTSDTYAIWIQPNGQKVTLDKCEIDMIDCTDGRGIKIDEQYVDAPEKVTLVVKNTQFATEEKSAILVKSEAGADITLENVGISDVVADSVYAVWVDEDSAQHADKVTVTGGYMIVEGSTDTYWYDVEDEEFELSTAKQLAGLAELVNGGGDFDGKTIKLTSDVDLSGENFAPIGGVDKGVAFQGTFDGQGHTIKGLTQNGWDLGYEYGEQAGMGLFGWVTDATIKNVKIDAAEVSMEAVVMGAVAGYATGDCTFENITVSNTQVANYNWDTGGIVGQVYGSGSTFVFKDIVIEESTTISGHWGTWDVSAGGVIGRTADGVKVEMENVTVAAKLDVFNDVCAAYQWYAYRYSGMLVGYTKTTETVDGRTVATAPHVTCKNVTVIYDDWANYTYCQASNVAPQYVRVQGGYSTDPYYSGRHWTAGVDAAGNKMVDDNHVHDEGEAHNELIVFDQLFGGGQGVYGSDAHEGVTVVYNNK